MPSLYQQVNGLILHSDRLFPYGGSFHTDQNLVLLTPLYVFIL
jgi:hypothetical protein